MSWAEKPRDLEKPEGARTGRVYRCMHCEHISTLASEACPEHGLEPMAFVGWWEGAEEEGFAVVPGIAVKRAGAVPFKPPFPDSDEGRRQQVAYEERMRRAKEARRER